MRLDTLGQKQVQKTEQYEPQTLNEIQDIVTMLTLQSPLDAYEVS